MSLSPSDAASVAALTRVAQQGGSQVSAPARAAFLQSFVDQTDPALPEAERESRGHALMKAHMRRLAAKSAQAKKDAGLGDELVAHIAAVVAGAPPLTPEQRDRLAGMLAPFAGDTAC